MIFNATAQLIALGAVVLLQTAYSVAVARLLGVEDFGTFSFVFSIIQILLIGGDFGLHNTAVRKIAPRVVAGRNAAAADVFQTFFFVKIILSSALVGCAGVLSILLPEGGGA